MDLLNMTKPKSMNFIRSLEEIFIFRARVLQFADLLQGWKLETNTKFQLNISKIMPARQKKTLEHEYHSFNLSPYVLIFYFIDC